MYEVPNRDYSEAMTGGNKWQWLQQAYNIAMHCNKHILRYFLLKKCWKRMEMQFSKAIYTGNYDASQKWPRLSDTPTVTSIPLVSLQVLVADWLRRLLTIWQGISIRIVSLSIWQPSNRVASYQSITQVATNCSSIRISYNLFCIHCFIYRQDPPYEINCINFPHIYIFLNAHHLGPGFISYRKFISSFTTSKYVSYSISIYIIENWQKT